MSALTLVDPANATGKSKELLDFVQQQRGRIPNMVRLMANSPAALDAYLGFARATAQTSLGDELQGLVAVAVASTTRCDYTLGIALAIAERSRATPAAIDGARRAESADPVTRLALEFAHDLVAQGGHLPPTRVDALKQAGLTDAQVADIVATACLNVYRSYFNLVARPELDFPVAVPAGAAQRG